MIQEARALLEIARDLIDTALAMGAVDKARLARIQTRLAFAFERLGLPNADEEATRSAATVMLTFSQRHSKSMSEAAKTMRELHAITSFQQSLAKSINGWLASRRK